MGKYTPKSAQNMDVSAGGHCLDIEKSIESKNNIQAKFMPIQHWHHGLLEISE